MEVVSEESKGPSKESFGLCAPVLCRRESSFKKMCKAVLFLMKIFSYCISAAVSPKLCSHCKLP